MAANSDSEKMAALKKAYADIILNTAKESAARILAAERKAIRFQRSLCAAKEEALAMLLRLKTLMDSKIKEAENTSLSQVRRIGELEVQLREAESTITSLREELERVNNQVKKIKGDLVEPSNEQNTNKDNDSDMPAELTQMNQDSDCCSNRNTIRGESLKDLSREKECGSNPDLASIIMRSKEPELYRNGCTQRIRAFEHNVRTVKVPHEQSDIPDLMNESNLTENRKNGGPNNVDSARIVKLVSEEEKKPMESEGYGHALLHVISPRKPRTKCIKIKSQGFASSRNQDNSGVVLTNKSVSQEPPHKMLRLHPAPISVSCTGAENRRLSLSKTFRNENSGLSPCNNRAVIKQLNGQNEICETFLYRTEECSGHGDCTKDIILSSTTEIDDSKLTPADENNAENRDSSDMKDSVPAINSIPKVETDCESCGTLPQAGKDKILRYTFQRKRKRGSSGSKNESVLTEKTTEENKSVDEQNVLVEPQKSILVTDLPRNNRRLMQVARQLISLSEKRW